MTLSSAKKVFIVDSRRFIIELVLDDASNKSGGLMTELIELSSGKLRFGCTKKLSFIFRSNRIADSKNFFSMFSTFISCC